MTETGRLALTMVIGALLEVAAFWAGLTPWLSALVLPAVMCVWYLDERRRANTTERRRT